MLLRDVSHWMPQGPHQRTLQRLHSEVQMLLYNHRFNAERAARGLPPSTPSGCMAWASWMQKRYRQRARCTA